MILQALNEYYGRMAREPNSGIPPYGFGEQGISFCLVLSADGLLRQVVDLRESGGKKAMPRTLVAPMLPSKRSIGVDPNFTWDNTGYVLGVDDKGKPERTKKTFEAFKTLHREILEGCGDEGLLALVRFLEDWSPDRFESLTGHEDMLGANLVFQLEGGEGRYLHERPRIQKAWQDRYRKRAGSRHGICLVTGEEADIAELHPEISGVAKAQSTGALLVSFNKESFDSYGKEKGLNSPVGERVAFAYTTAINFLLRNGSRQKIQVGDATVVFWAERDTPSENLLALLFNPPVEEEKLGGTNGPEDDPAMVARVREVLKAVRAGMSLGEVDTAIDPDVRYYILGLSPSEARLSVRFWNVSTFGQLVSRIGQHFADLAIERQCGHYDKDPEYPPLRCIALETAPWFWWSCSRPRGRVD
jgi:CRISPR-associated protein Csd1